ncbi:hypothetical protein [Chryseobacterium luteum]|uniref:Uncharacterized protein n=1 Tax=Chryseobacterium luteum TaxID=421531 RepID=A0A085ZF87_9FLAO|nr:hypothetical protein [Chryseobacterium luteum]KFF03101.1 hypothetical protein IX38_12065 [Chryseobacterium luteum]
MDNKTPLHIYVESKTGQKFHKDIGWLELKKAESFNVYIKEYKDRKDVLDQQLKKDLDKANNDYTTKSNAVEKEAQQSYAFLSQNHEDYKAGKVKEETYDANVKKREEGMAARKKKYTELGNAHNKNIEGINKQYKTDLKAIQDDYKSVRWVHQLVGDRRPELTAESFNEAMKMGTSAFNFSFSEFLEGGGAVYLEPFWEGTKPQGKYPHGILINAKGQHPDVITAEWTDADNHKVSKTLKFGSSVYLNIYTDALYGNNIKVQLKDKDKVIRIITLGMTDADDKLFAAEYLNNNTEERTEEDISKQEEFFERPVSVHQEKTVPSKAKTGYLVEDDGNKHDGNATGKPNVQKSKFAVFIDPLWQTMGGDYLEIYPVVHHNRIPGGKKILQDCILKIDSNAADEIKVNESNSNQVVVLSQVETNLQHFNPCGYDTITALLETTEYPIFRRKISEIDSELLLEIISSDKTKNLFIYLPDLDTKECTYNNTIEYHTGKVISLKDPETHYRNLKKNTEDISFDVSYPRPTTPQLIDYAWLPNAKPIRYGLQFITCRFQHPLVINVYPELEYNFNAHIGVDEDKYLYVIQSKNYKKKKYKAQKGSDTKAAKKAYNKQQKQKFTDDVNNEITSENFLKEYEFSIEFEAKFADEKSFSIEGSNTKLEEILEKAVYIYNIIDSYVGGSKMKEAENSPEKKKQFDKDKGTREKKRKRDKSTLPLRFEVSPPKFTGGVAWKFAQSIKQPNLIGVEYEFKLGALPLVSVTGRLDLLFAAQFIPYINGVVKILDGAVATISQAGEIMEFFGVGNMEADYYFDFVTTANLNIDFVKGAKYHTIDGFSGSEISVYSEVELGLEAGGYLKVELFDLVGEASIHAETKAKFKYTWTPERPKYLKFEFEGIEALIYAKIKVETNGGDDTEENGDEIPDISVEKKNEQTKKFDDVEIFKPFEIDIKLFD